MNKNEAIADTLENIPASRIEEPGQGYGPCRKACVHRSCAWQREIVARHCCLCGLPIGYGLHFYEYDGDVVHRACLEDEIEVTKPTPVH